MGLIASQYVLISHFAHSIGLWKDHLNNLLLTEYGHEEKKYCQRSETARVECNRQNEFFKQYCPISLALKHNGLLAWTFHRITYYGKKARDSFGKRQFL